MAGKFITGPARYGCGTTAGSKSRHGYDPVRSPARAGTYPCLSFATGEATSCEVDLTRLAHSPHCALPTQPEGKVGQTLRRVRMCHTETVTPRCLG